MDDGWRALFKGLPSRTRTLARTERLFGLDDEIRSLYAVERGLIRLSRTGMVIHRAGPGQLVAPESLFTPRFEAEAVAERACVVTVFSKAAVLLQLSAHPQLALGFAASLGRQLAEARVDAEILRLKTASDRILAWLALQGGAVSLEGSLMALAARLGLSHEALYRTLARLEQDGRLIRPDRRTVRLL